MIDYLTNRPTAYRPIPGPPVNPTLQEPAMTTETKVDLISGRRLFYQQAGEFGWEIAHTLTFNGAVEIICRVPNEATAEYMCHACNLHAELVAFVEATLMARSWFEDHPELALAEIEHRAKVVSISLPKAQP